MSQAGQRRMWVVCRAPSAVMWHPGAHKCGARVHNRMADPSSRKCVMLSRFLDLDLPRVDQRWPHRTAERTWLSGGTVLCHWGA